jgi:hypothetical protein
MTYMCASVVKGMKFSVIATDYKHAYGQSAVFQSQSAAWLLNFRCALQVDHDFAVAEGPALRIERLGSRRQAENTLKEAAIKEFHGHSPSTVGSPPVCSHPTTPWLLIFKKKCLADSLDFVEVFLV